MESEDKKPTVRSVFGKEIEVEKLMGIAADEMWAIQPSLLTVENGDPKFTYAWLVADDPETALKLRKGMWELVDPKTDPCIAAGATKSDKTYRLRELVLARMPKERYEAIKAAARARAVHREVATEEQFRQTIRGVARQISPDQTGVPSVSKSETIKDSAA